MLVANDTSAPTCYHPPSVTSLVDIDDYAELHSYPDCEALANLLLSRASIAGQKMSKIMKEVKNKAQNPDVLYGVGIDGEPGFSGNAGPFLGPKLAIALAKGMATIEGGSIMAFGYNSSGGCESGGTCKNGWTLEDMAHVSVGWPNRPIHVLPQIYAPYQRARWQNVARYWRGQGNKFNWYGVTAQQDPDPVIDCRLHYYDLKQADGSPGADGIIDIDPRYTTAKASWSGFHTKRFAPNLKKELVQFDCPWDTEPRPANPEVPPQEGQ